MNRQAENSKLLPIRSRKSTPSSRRIWTPVEESALLDGLKKLRADGWRADNETFRRGYLMELEHYLHECHHSSQLKGEPHVNNKVKAWKRCYSNISLLKSRSGLRFQYSDGTIIVDDPKQWDDFIKMDPKAKSMKTKKWPMFEDWEEIFGKDRATGEFTKGPLDVAEDILRSQASGISNDMSLGWPIVVDDEGEDDAGDGPNIATGEAENENTYDGPSFTGASEKEDARASEQECAGAFENEHAGFQQNHKQGEHANRSSSNFNEKEKSKKRKRVVEDSSETFLKGMTEVMKNFIESQDKRMGALIDKIDNCDRSDIRSEIYSILESPAFELYSVQEYIKATMILCEDVKKMKLFLRMGELEHQTMMFMIINGKL
ncbi:uncharacterized protein LOC107805084 [Nicotiana tabacum]|uniref:L10-interacting MYB domain-containing protein-like n=1 Tax=Nicotiana tabacum TaxID=4097 RepID=A0A1S4B6T3_TOBAC|nr:PREDICTED: uncharacterized protein LOC107805084 [Nicotiana tabacum]XP_016484551.1 PREDICTED: uncharacterized protein LOC107805084 [Nicotiana tabacum]XP_016484552.1 PREDICTED: uncharacterized protein LOC107805084 [Nicotiana tabacum]